MVSSNNSVWPPPGWKVVVKSKNGRKVKYYFNSKTLQKFYSKPSLLRFIRDGCVSDEKPEPVIEHSKKKSGDLQMRLVDENEYDWLPAGWDVERRIRKSGTRTGTEYKCYIDSSTGSKFFSKPEVLRYLKSKQRIAETSKVADRKRSRHSVSKRLVDPVSAHKSNLEPKVSQISKTRVRKSLSSGNLKVVTERTVDEDLPSGWIKEMRIKMLGNKVVRRDPFFFDPASRLVFRSKLEVLRYVETGEISRHAYQRKIGNVIGEDSANGKTSKSSKHEGTPKSRTRNKLFSSESSSMQSIQELPEASGNKKVEGRYSRRLSSRGKAATAGSSSLKQSIFSPKSPNNSQELVVAKPLMEKLSGTKDSSGITKHAPSEVQDDVAVVATRLLPEENQVTLAVQHCSNGKASTSKRKTNARKLLSVPSRSSKRLAGVEAKVEFHSIPIEHALRATSRKPSRTKPISDLEFVTDEVQEKCQDVDRQNVPVPKEIKHQTVVALQATRRKPSRTKPISSLESVPDELQEKCQDVDKQNVPVSKEVKHQIVEALQATRRKPSIAKPISSLESVPDEVQGKCQDVDKQNLFVSKEVKHKTVEVNAVSIVTAEGELTNTIDDLPSQKEKHSTVDVNSDTELATKGESTKIDDFTSEEQNHSLLNVDPETVFAAAHGEASNRMDKGLTAKDTLLVDLSDLQLEEAPPGFSDNMKVGVSSVKIKQSFEHPSDTLQGSKVENSSRERPMVKEKLASVEREIEQPKSEYSFPPPLWSDPCLEFAFKTLTGAIPFDDNLAIQDYIQHQLRTSEENDNNQCLSDVCAPSVRKSDETNRAPQLPEDVNVPNFTKFGSPEINQVKNK